MVDYLAKGLKSLGTPFNETITTAVVIPFAVVVMWRAVRRVRRHVDGSDHGADHSPP
ncbi:DUF3422 family protein [Mycobacterium sp.]|uniref:DUF3422 family protein n=1 Tax=Mycobacterium sp. TaxID=1785 RepID=UPI0012841D14|nr:MAG: DUF3422 family protein [Mycobacterium sp.]